MLYRYVYYTHTYTHINGCGRPGLSYVTRYSQTAAINIAKNNANIGFFIYSCRVRQDCRSRGDNKFLIIFSPVFPFHSTLLDAVEYKMTPVNKHEREMLTGKRITTMYGRQQFVLDTFLKRRKNGCTSVVWFPDYFSAVVLFVKRNRLLIGPRI